MIVVTKYVLKLTNPDKRLVESGKVYIRSYNNPVVLIDALMYPMADHAKSYSMALEGTDVKKIQITMEEVE